MANDHVNWQPISQMMPIVSMIDSSLDDTREHPFERVLETSDVELASQVLLGKQHHPKN